MQTQVVQRPRDQVLASSGLAQDERGLGVGGDALNQFEDFLRERALPEDIASSRLSS